MAADSPTNFKIIRNIISATSLCVVSNDERIEGFFGKNVGINKVDGINYTESVNYTLVCDANLKRLGFGDYQLSDLKTQFEWESGIANQYSRFRYSFNSKMVSLLS